MRAARVGDSVTTITFHLAPAAGIDPSACGTEAHYAKWIQALVFGALSDAPCKHGNGQADALLSLKGAKPCQKIKLTKNAPAYIA
jgi:hypothetical protein